MLKPVDGQGSFYDADQVCDRLIPPDSFYRKFRELVVPLIKDDQFESMYCKDNGRPWATNRKECRTIIQKGYPDIPSGAASWASLEASSTHLT